MKIGIIASKPQEIEAILKKMTHANPMHYVERDFYLGKFLNIDTVTVLSYSGKVATSITTSILIEKFAVDFIIFIGVAGAITPELNIGDVVIADKLIQHDMDASPIFPRFEIPLTQKSLFIPKMEDVDLAYVAAKKFLLEQHSNAKILIGAIATGDQFIHAFQTKEQLKKDIPNLLCVDMESAASAQVCEDFRIPYIVARTISDKADGEAPADFLTFLNEVASLHALGIVTNLYQEITVHTQVV